LAGAFGAGAACFALPGCARLRHSAPRDAARDLALFDGPREAGDDGHA
jgi:hypothetical protein